MSKNRILMISLILVSMSIIAFIGCESSSSPSYEAKYFKVKDLEMSVGYYWVGPEIKSYVPDDAIINEISNAYISSYPVDSTKIYCFTSLTCSCTQPQLPFPRLLKSLQNAGVPDSNIIIYSMEKTIYNHPYKNILTINSLPSFFIVKDGVPVYSIMDTINAFQKINKDSVYKIEQFILYGLQTN